MSANSELGLPQMGCNKWGLKEKPFSRGSEERLRNPPVSSDILGFQLFLSVFLVFVLGFRWV